MTGKLIHLGLIGEYKPGDPRPSGYIQWHEWVRVQHKAGLRQASCAQCGRWNYPQEFSDQTSTTYVTTKTGKSITMIGRICKRCFEGEGE